MFKINLLSTRVIRALVVKVCRATLPVCAFLLASAEVGIAGSVTTVVDGRRAIVIDERLSALRTKPELTATLVQRLRRGRVIGITGAVRGREGIRFYRVAVTRRTRGWILADAVVRAGSENDVARLIDLIEGEKDGFGRVKLASLCVNEFRRTRLAPRALLLLGESADRVAPELTRLAQRRLKADAKNARTFLLNDVGLDRYNRLGVRFRFEENESRLVYDGAAYRELLRRYPRSQEAEKARDNRLSRT